MLMPELPQVTDPTQRADLARWAVSLRRAFAAGTRQATGQMHTRFTPLSMLYAEDSYCCLGIWSAVQVAAGVLVRKPAATGSAVSYCYASAVNPPGVWREGALPDEAKLGTSNDPELIRLVSVDNGTIAVSASDLNDHHGLNFAQIADVVVWRYGLTDAELEAAELAPRVPEVEGPHEGIGS